MHQYIGVFGNNNWPSTRTKHSKQILQMFSFFFKDSIKLTPLNCWQRLVWKNVCSLLCFFFIPLPWNTFGQIVSQAFVGLTFLLFQVNGMSSVTHIAMKDDIMILGDVTGALYLMNTSKKTMKRCSIWMNWKWQVVNMWFWTYTLSLMFP